MKMRGMYAVAVGCLLFLGVPTLILAQNIVVPNALANAEGNSNNGFPFNIGAFSVSTLRYQQVYSKTQFSAITGPTLINAISFRPDVDSGSSFNTLLSNIQISLSTTAALPGGLSTTFATNVGGDNTLVYSGALALSSSYTGGSPKDFDIVITLQNPFFYDPANGNLLMDVSNFGGEITTQFDADSNDGLISRAFSTDVNSTTADGADSFGLVTQFSFAAVPEPTTWVLIGVGTLGTGAYTWRKRRLAIKAGMAKLKT
jgi:PEP-CTERM motif